MTKASLLAIGFNRERASSLAKRRLAFGTTPEHYLFVTDELLKALDKLEKIKEISSA